MIEKKMELGATAIYDLTSDNTEAQGISVNIPGTELHILQVRCKSGMLFCGLFSHEVLEKLDFAAAVFSAPEFTDMMERKPVFLTSKAIAIGANMDMTGMQLLELFNTES